MDLKSIIFLHDDLEIDFDAICLKKDSVKISYDRTCNTLSDMDILSQMDIHIEKEQAL